MTTQGPWYQTASDPAGICVYAEDGGAHRRIAVLDALGVNGAGAANARLIAAAPEMLNALKWIVSWIDAGCDPSEKSIERARALLAKIEGRPQAD